MCVCVCVCVCVESLNETYLQVMLFVGLFIAGTLAYEMLFS